MPIRPTSSRRPPLSVTLAVLGSLVVSACDASSGPSVVARFDPTLAPGPTEADTWLAFPFPSDHRRTADGRPRFDDFPNPRATELLDEWRVEAQTTLTGFSLSGLAYFAFDGGALDVSGLPTDPADYLDDESPILLVDVTTGDAGFGRRWPVRTHYFRLEGALGGVYLVPETLGVGPAWGFPLVEEHTYAVVVRDTVRAADGSRLGRPALLDALLDDRAAAPRATPAIPPDLYESLRARWAGLRDYLASAAIDADSVVVATVFTTQGATDELAAIAAQIRDSDSPPTMTGDFDRDGGGVAFTTSNFAWNSTETTTYATYRGRYVAPNYQEGEIPYASAGGALHFVDGIPTKVRDESIDFVLTVPDAPPEASRGCYPIVMYGHGTGGDRASMVRDRTAARLAARGMAAISIDMPLHGVRAEGMTLAVDFLTFNFTNAASFRSNFRQGAVDLFSLVRFVRESLAIPAGTSHTGEAIAFCDDGVGYMGHSQGGLTGSLALPFLDVPTAVLSGAGGGISLSVMLRKDIIDFAALFRLAFDVPEEEDWGDAHPLATLVQTLADVSDPQSYARYWSVDTTHRSPANVMLTSGRHDEATPYLTATHLALAAELPPTVPVVIPVPEYGVLDLAPRSTPYSANVGGSTTGFLQYTDDLAIEDADTHFLVFHRPEAIDATMHFLQTGTTTSGVAELRRVPTADAR